MENAITISPEVIKEWGLEEMPEEKRKDIVERIGRMLYQAVILRAMDILGDEEQNELDQITSKEGANAEDVLKFLEKKIPNFSEIVSEEREKIKNDILV